jgi:hypothetical protein
MLDLCESSLIIVHNGLQCLATFLLIMRCPPEVARPPGAQEQGMVPYHGPAVTLPSTILASRSHPPPPLRSMQEARHHQEFIIYSVKRIGYTCISRRPGNT